MAFLRSDREEGSDDMDNSTCGKEDARGPAFAQSGPLRFATSLCGVWRFWRHV
jgi:hypothetical protein